MAEPQITITIENSPPVRTTDGGWEFEMWAIAQRGTSRGNPASGQMVEFFVNNEKRETKQAEQDGRTFRQRVMVPSGVLAVSIEAQREEDATTRSPKIVRWEGTTTKPARVEHFERMEQDKSLLVILVLDGNDNPVAGEPIHIMDKDDPRMVYPLDAPTDRHGFARCEIHIATQRKEVIVLVRGIQRIVQLGLPPDFNPRMPYETPPPEHTPEYDLNAPPYKP